MPAGTPTRPRSHDALLGALLIIAAVVAYSPALSGALVWDDDAHITRGALQGWDGLRHIWFTLGATQQYYPVLHSAFWLEHRLWGDATVGYHAVTLGWHLLASLLLVELGRRLEIRGVWVAAALFALHPVHVESVAWISEQKNTLSLVFYLLAAIAWTRFDATRSRTQWAVACALFALALGTKTVTATLPAALLVVVWWKRGRIEWRRDVVPLLPWFALGIASGLGTAWLERHVIGAEGDEFSLNLIERALLAARATWHYLTAFVWPARLVFMYPRWRISATDTAAWGYAAAVVALFGAAWGARQRTRAPLAGLLVFVGTLVPVLGFLNVYPFRYSWVADHFQYHADVALVLLSGAAAAWVADRAVRLGRGMAAAQVALVGLLGLCIGLTAVLAGHYRDAETLYRATLDVNPSSWMAQHNLGRLVSRKAGGLDEAIAHFEAAIALKPDHARAHYALAVALQRVGRGAEAVPHLEAAIRYEANNPVLVANAHYIAGDILRHDPARLGEAIAHLEEAVRRKPDVAEAHRTLAAALGAAGRNDEARRENDLAARLERAAASASSSSPRSR